MEKISKQVERHTDSIIKLIFFKIGQVFSRIFFAGVLGILLFYQVFAISLKNENPNSYHNTFNGVPSTPGIDYVEIIEDHLNSGDIFVDNFEDGKTLSEKYADYNLSNGDFMVTNSMGFGGSAHSLMAKWVAGQVNAGSFAYMFGRNPVASLSNSNVDFQEIYWRFYVKTSPGWIGNPFKLTRATIIASTNWAQAMIAHLWGEPTDLMLTMDPASGIDAGDNLVTTKYNDFNNLKWLGKRTGKTPIYEVSRSGSWQCVEVHIKLNTPGASDGIFEFWIDNNLEASRNDLNWVGTWTKYGINTVMFGNYWNGGAPQSETRYMDNFVISTRRIGLAVSPVNPVVVVTLFSSDVGGTQQGLEYQVSLLPDSSNIVFGGAMEGTQNQFQVNNSFGKFTGILDGKSVLDSATAYYVRVRYVDNFGKRSSWSAWKIFQTGDFVNANLPRVPKGMRIDSK